MALKPACRKGDISSGHGPFNPRPITSGSDSVFINGQPAARKTDEMLTHCSGNSCHNDPIAEGSDSVFINGLNATRVGDAMGCDEVMKTGSSNVYIGGDSV